MRPRLLALASALAVFTIGCGDPEPVAVSGQAPCVEVLPIGSERDRYECDENLDDERVSGPSLVTVTEVDFDATPIETAGTWKLENDDGIWEGNWTGVIEADGLHTAEGVMTGSGDYEGLVYRARWEFYDLDDITATGTIEPTA